MFLKPMIEYLNHLRVYIVFRFMSILCHMNMYGLMVI